MDGKNYLPLAELPKHHEDMLTLKLAVEKADNLAQHAKKARFLFGGWEISNQVFPVGGLGSTWGGVLDGFFMFVGHFGNQKVVNLMKVMLI